MFAADTHTDMKEWMSAMKEALMEDKQRNRRKKTQSMIAVQQPPERTTPGLSASGTSEVPLTINQPELTPRDNPYEPSNSGVCIVLGVLTHESCNGNVVPVFLTM